MHIIKFHFYFCCFLLIRRYIPEMLFFRVRQICLRIRNCNQLLVVTVQILSHWSFIKYHFQCLFHWKNTKKTFYKKKSTKGYRVFKIFIQFVFILIFKGFLSSVGVYFLLLLYHLKEKRGTCKNNLTVGQKLVNLSTFIAVYHCLP